MAKTQNLQTSPGKPPSYRGFIGALREWRDGVNPPVFFGAAILTWGLIAFGSLWTKTAGSVFSHVLNFIAVYFGSYYVLTMTGFVVFVFWLLFSRYGKVRLGGPESRPDFGYFSWFSMLFAAGMGMGLVFWGVAEPLYHLMGPPTAAPQTAAAAREAMRFSFFHWGVHPWSVYVVFALGIAYFHFRHHLPLAPRSLLYPLLGERYNGWIGHFADAFCTFGTLLGVATSLGLGAMQINAGLDRLGGLPYSTSNQVWIIAVITAIATASTVSGVSRGIKYLSVINVVLMVVLLSFVFVMGPTLYQVKVLLTTTGDYLQQFISTSLWMDLRSDSDWQMNWTLFYWGWWISWAPFVGIFIARVSKGRTIREFIFWVLLIPMLVNFIWFSVFGGSAMFYQLADGTLAGEVMKNVATSLSRFLEYLPVPHITQWFAVLLAVIFFITSSDSGSFVDDMVTTGGNPNPPVANRVFWGASEGAAAAVLLLAGGLKALQSASIAAGLPQSLLVVASCVSLGIALRREREIGTLESGVDLAAGD